MKNTNSQTKIFFIIIFLVAFLFVITFTTFVLWVKPTDKQQKKSSTQKSEENKLQTPPSITPDYDNIKRANNKARNNTSFSTGLEHLPQSLQGTSVDGEIIINENKQLVVTRGLRRLFDYFLSATGEEPTEIISARVESYIISHTPEPASSQAVTIFQSYLLYLQAISTIEADFGSLQMRATESGEFDSSLLKQRRNAIKKLRTQYFDDTTITTFFSQDDDQENYSLAMMDIEKNEQLSMEQKQQGKQDYIDSLPDSADKQAMKKFNQQQANITNLLQRTEALRKQGASAEQLYDMRVELVGKLAAKRLANVDKEEKNFEERFIEYQQKKKSITKNTNMSHSQYSQAIQQKINKIEQALFNEIERKRLTGYEAVYSSQHK